MSQRKFSRQRESIVENLKCRTDHPTADMVYSDIRQIYPNISLGTVYRNLSLLAEEHEIRKLISSDGVAHFDYNKTPHEHFICRKCGRVADTHLTDPEAFKENVSKKYDGLIEKCDIIFHGLCSDCMSKN